MLTFSLGIWHGNIACNTHHVAVRRRSISPAM